MTLTFHPDRPWPSIAKDMANKKRGPVVAVIAYVGRAAPSLLDLGKGDALVCDASVSVIAGGGTSALALQRLHRRGVQIYSREGLHAKVIAARRFAWVGSANASKHSRDDLVEAAVRLTDKKVVDGIREWCEALCTDDALLTANDIKQLTAIPVTRRPPRPRRQSRRIDLPTRVSHAHLLWTTTETSDDEQRAAQDERPAVRAGQGLKSADLSWIAWNIDLPKELQEGCYVIELRGNRPRKPARVVRISDRGTFKLIWLSRCNAPHIPKKAEIASLLGSHWKDGMDVRLSGPVADRLLALYR